MLIDPDLRETYKQLKDLSIRLLDIESVFLEVDEQKVIRIICDDLKEFKGILLTVENQLSKKCDCCTHKK